MRDLGYRSHGATALPRGLIIGGLALTSWIAVAGLWQVTHLVFSAILR